MIKVLVNAYACSPNMGSEPGMAWNWCVHLAEHCELHIITEGEFREKIEETLPNVPYGQNMHFYYNEVSPKVRKMCWNQGDWRFYWHYKKWQKKTYQIAKEIIAKENIDIIHQLNMIGFREPGYLWKFDNIPFVWGPINAKEGFPYNYLKGASIKTKLFIILKNFLTQLQLRFSKRVKEAIKKSSFVIAASKDSANSIKKFYKKNAIIINETGLRNTKNNEVKVFSSEKLKLLWVGRFIFSKQLMLALKIVSILDKDKFTLNIVGGEKNEELKYQTLAKKLNINAMCVWHGKVSNEEVNVLMQNSDMLLFTSVFEGTPHVVLEAINNNLPIVCFDTCGQADIVNENIGIKIPLSDPKISTRDFKKTLDYFYDNRKNLQTLSLNCDTRKKELSWSNKAKQVINLYKKSIMTNV